MSKGIGILIHILRSTLYAWIYQGYTMWHKQSNLNEIASLPSHGITAEEIAKKYLIILPK